MVVFTFSIHNADRSSCEGWVHEMALKNDSDIMLGAGYAGWSW